MLPETIVSISVPNGNIILPLTRSKSFGQARTFLFHCYSRAASDNQATWQTELDQYRRAVEAERQLMEQRRVALELKQQQQRERQHNLKLLGQWQEAAISLGKPASYVERIQAVTSDYQGGLPLSDQTIAARQKDLAAYQQQMQRHQQELKQTQDLERERKKQERGRGFSR